MHVLKILASYVRSGMTLNRMALSWLSPLTMVMNSGWHFTSKRSSYRAQTAYIALVLSVTFTQVCSAYKMESFCMSHQVMLTCVPSTQACGGAYKEAGRPNAQVKEA